MPLTRTLILSAATVMAGGALHAEAGEKRVFMDVGAVSALHDRGEQLGRETLGFGAGVEFEVQEAIVYGAFSRILPVGDQQAAFDDEADYTQGVAWSQQGYSADISANWLTYPGEETEASLEMVGAVTLEAPFAPTLIGFYDTDLKDWGLEFAAGPEWELGNWTLAAIGRAGFVQPSEDAAHRSYAGIELAAARPVSKSVEFGFFARADTADEASFAHRFENGEVTSFRNSGIAAGISLAFIR